VVLTLALGVEVEAVAVGLGEADAHAAARDGEHEGDGLGSDELGWEDEVALVLAVLVAGQDDHLAGAEVGSEVGSEVGAEVVDGGEAGIGNGGDCWRVAGRRPYPATCMR
jgi:hypothetical protein